MAHDNISCVMSLELSMLGSFTFDNCLPFFQDIIRRYKRCQPDSKSDVTDFSQLPDKIAVQLNDTHPAMAIPELMRLLMDEEGLEYDEVSKKHSYKVQDNRLIDFLLIL